MKTGTLIILYFLVLVCIALIGWIVPLWFHNFYGSTVSTGVYVVFHVLIGLLAFLALFYFIALQPEDLF